jgi:hypothetical protein
MGLVMFFNTTEAADLRFLYQSNG